MRRLSTTLVLIGLIAISATWTGAQAPPEGTIARLPLLDLPGDLVSVRYSAGALQRAVQVQDPFELLVGDFAKWSGSRNRIAVLLLSRDEWQQAGISMPYGLPARVHGSSLASAAWGDPGTVDLWGRLLGWDMPAAEDAPLRSTAEEAASLIATDLLSYFEGARMLTEMAGYSGSEPWLTEVAAHTAAATVIARTPGTGLAGAARLYGNLAAARGGAVMAVSQYRSGLSLEEWLWFQARFFEAARLILESEKRGAAKSIFKLARKNNGRLTRGALVKRYPALEDWLAKGFAPDVP